MRIAGQEHATRVAELETQLHHATEHLQKNRRRVQVLEGKCASSQAQANPLQDELSYSTQTDLDDPTTEQVPVILGLRAGFESFYLPIGRSNTDALYNSSKEYKEHTRQILQLGFLQQLEDLQRSVSHLSQFAQLKAQESMPAQQAPFLDQTSHLPQSSPRFESTRLLLAHLTSPPGADGTFQHQIQTAAQAQKWCGSIPRNLQSGTANSATEVPVDSRS